MALTVEQQKFVQELANLAWGTGGKSEHAAGGKGNMGVLYDSETGAARIVKFNTHGSQAEKAQAQADRYKMESGNVISASNALRNEIEKFAVSAGIPLADVDRILGANRNERSLLTRKVVAKFVTHVAKQCAEMKDVWTTAQAEAKVSARDMSFEKVSRNEGDYAQFNLKAERLNQEAVDWLLNFKNGVEEYLPVMGHSGFTDAKNLDWVLNGQTGLTQVAHENRYLNAHDLAIINAKRREMEARGFGWLGEGKSLRVAIRAVYTAHEKNLTAEEVNTAVERLMRTDENLREEGWRFLANEDGNFEDFILKRYADRNIVELGKSEPLPNEAVQFVAEALEKSEFAKNKRADAIIRENLDLIEQVDDRYERTMASYNVRKEADPDCDKKPETMDILAERFDLRLLGKDKRTGRRLKADVHKNDGAANFIHSVETAHLFGRIYMEAKKQGRINELFAALTEGGCFQARMTAIQSFYEKMVLGTSEVNPVVHDDKESIHDGLVNELTMAVYEYKTDRHIPLDQDANIGWKDVKEIFGRRVLGKTFGVDPETGLKINWTAHKVYEHITEDELGWATVTADKDFKDHLATIEANKKGPYSIHFGEL